MGVDHNAWAGGALLGDDRAETVVLQMVAATPSCEVHHEGSDGLFCSGRSGGVGELLQQGGRWGPAAGQKGPERRALPVLSGARNGATSNRAMGLGRRMGTNPTTRVFEQSATSSGAEAVLGFLPAGTWVARRGG